jgi:hypothetical protein
MALNAQIDIAEDSAFRRRLRQALIQAAIGIFTEDGATPNHGPRLAFALEVLRGGADAHVQRLAYILPTLAAVETAGKTASDSVILDALTAVINPYTQVVA